MSCSSYVSLSLSSVFLCLGLECSGDSPSLNSLTLPLVSVLSHPGRPQDGLLEKAHFVPDNDGAVPALCRGLLSKGTGDRGIRAVLWLRADPNLGHCLQAWPSPPNGMLTIYVYISILNAHSAGLFCLSKFPVSLSIFPNLTTDRT